MFHFPVKNVDRNYVHKCIIVLDLQALADCYLSHVSSEFLNSLTTEKQTTKFSSANFQIKVQAVSYREIKHYRANSVDLDEMAHDEPPHQELRCLQTQLFSSLVVKELITCSLRQQSSQKIPPQTKPLMK